MPATLNVGVYQDGPRSVRTRAGSYRLRIGQAFRLNVSGPRGDRGNVLIVKAAPPYTVSTITVRETPNESKLITTRFLLSLRWIHHVSSGPPHNLLELFSFDGLTRFR